MKSAFATPTKSHPTAASCGPSTPSSRPNNISTSNNNNNGNGTPGRLKKSNSLTGISGAPKSPRGAPAGVGRIATQVVRVPAAAAAAANRCAAAVPDQAENVQVAVRVRSFLDRERKKNEELAIRMKDTTTEVRLPNQTKMPFTFDRCFWSNDVQDSEMPYTTQQDVFEVLGKPVVDNALAGLNASVIAYGQTGSGKTYSLFGPETCDEENKGLIPRVCENLFARLSAEKIPYKATVSITEVYMERVFDLLNSHKELNIRGDLTRGFSVIGGKKVDVDKYADIERLLQIAEARKTYNSTALNERSSRAHTVFELTMRSFGAGGVKVSRIMLVDLAGSERTKESKTEGKAFEQACNINLSLLHLGRCIEAVVSRGNGPVTEYRHSVLTKLLKESLGGNSKTMILATVSPSASDVNNTLHALRFADRAKQIKNHAVINEDSTANQQQHSEELRRLYEERMQALKTEYDLECKQSEINKRQIQLEEESARLDAERQELLRQRMESVKMTADERTKLDARERELESMLRTLNSELSEAQRLRDELDQQMAEVNTANALILQEKKAAEEEVQSLQAAINTQLQHHEEELNERNRIALRAEEALRTNNEKFETERDEYKAQFDALRAYAKAQTELGQSKMEEMRREHRNEVLGLTKQLTAATEEAKADFEKHSAQMAEVEKTLEQAREEHGANLAAAEEARVAVVGELEKMTSERDDALAMIEQLRAELEAERAKAAAAAEQHAAEKAALEAAVADLEEDKTNLQDALTEVNDSLVIITQQRDEAQAEVEDLRDAIEGERAERQEEAEAHREEVGVLDVKLRHASFVSGLDKLRTVEFRVRAESVADEEAARAAMTAEFDRTYAMCVAQQCMTHMWGQMMARFMPGASVPLVAPMSVPTSCAASTHDFTDMSPEREMSSARPSVVVTEEEDDEDADRRGVIVPGIACGIAMDKSASVATLEKSLDAVAENDMDVTETASSCYCEEF